MVYGLPSDGAAEDGVVLEGCGHIMGSFCLSKMVGLTHGKISGPLCPYCKRRVERFFTVSDYKMTRYEFQGTSEATWGQLPEVYVQNISS